LEKGDGFNVGDIVVFDLGNPENDDVLAAINKGIVINKPARVIQLEGKYIYITPKLHTGAGGGMWYASRFKLAKHLIVQQIINDL